MLNLVLGWFMFIFILNRGSLSCDLHIIFIVLTIGVRPLERMRAVLCIHATLLLAAAMTSKHTRKEAADSVSYLCVQKNVVKSHYITHCMQTVSLVITHML